MLIKNSIIGKEILSADKKKVFVWLDGHNDLSATALLVLFCVCNIFW